MRFLRALLNSGVFMIILLAAATLYLVYSDAIKREHGIDVTSEKAAAETAVNVPATTVPAVQESTANAAMTTTQQESSPVVITQQAVTVAQEPIQAEPAFETQPQQQAYSSMPPMMPYQQPMDMQPMPPMMPYQQPMDMPQMQPMPPMMPEQVQQQMQPMPVPEQMPMPSPMPVVEQSNLDKARAALYSGDLEVAKQAYQVELATNNDPDLHGELGNVYFAQQDWSGAAREYAAAVDGLSAQGRFLQAQYVLGFLMQINPEMGQQAMNNLKTQMYPQK